ncbi:hypothetical protein HNQ43_001215 [Faecalicoccus acidiformans]|uniref:Uncharacterized protein n=1 Tax=Faecalicoccus acidiformans TaxID=915173 RepID=A0A7W8D311_9FIRM|nr:hypothetical protein [Faecalicoccus acidiformans]MBB5185162.1 hypothetical protein [Faecalicoccus acidiformans]
MSNCIDIFFKDYESFLESLEAADRNEDIEEIRIHFLSLYKKMDPLQQILVLQMSLNKLHKKCFLYFPFPSDGSMTKDLYQTYVRELKKLKNVYLDLDS